MSARRKMTAAEALYPIPRTGDTYLVNPATGERDTVAKLVREMDGPNARTFTITRASDRSLMWIRHAGPSGWVDAKLHVDLGGWHGEKALWPKDASPNQTLMTAMDVIPDELAAFSRAYPEEAA